MNFFSDFFYLLENFKFLKNCPQDFDQILHVPCNDYWASGYIQFMLEVTWRGPGHSSKRGEFDVFSHFLVFGFSPQKLPVGIGLNSIMLLMANTFHLVPNLRPQYNQAAGSIVSKMTFFHPFLTVFGLIRFFLKNCPQDRSEILPSRSAGYNASKGSK